jgi:hypothetical protein
MLGDDPYYHIVFSLLNCFTFQYFYLATSNVVIHNGYDNVVHFLAVFGVIIQWHHNRGVVLPETEELYIVIQVFDVKVHVIGGDFEGSFDFIRQHPVFANEDIRRILFKECVYE